MGGMGRDATRGPVRFPSSSISPPPPSAAAAAAAAALPAACAEAEEVEVGAIPPVDVAEDVEACVVRSDPVDAAVVDDEVAADDAVSSLPSASPPPVVSSVVSSIEAD